VFLIIFLLKYKIYFTIHVYNYYKQNCPSGRKVQNAETKHERHTTIGNKEFGESYAELLDDGQTDKHASRVVLRVHRGTEAIGAGDRGQQMSAVRERVAGGQPEGDRARVGNGAAGYAEERTCAAQTVRRREYGHGHDPGRVPARRIGIETPEPRASGLAEDVDREHKGTDAARARIERGAEPKRRVAVVVERDEGGIREDGSSVVGREQRAEEPAGAEIGGVGGDGATSEQENGRRGDAPTANGAAEDGDGRVPEEKLRGEESGRSADSRAQGSGRVRGYGTRVGQRETLQRAGKYGIRNI